MAKSKPSPTPRRPSLSVHTEPAALAAPTAGPLGSSVLLGLAVGLGVAELEQATTASSREKNEPVRARPPVRTLSTPIIDVAVASLTPRPPLLLCGRQAPFRGRPVRGLGAAR